MRIELWDTDGRVFGISSLNLRIVGDWFADVAPRLMTSNAPCQPRIQIWPDTPAEKELIGVERWARTRMLEQDELLALAQRILEASQALADRESKLQRPV